MAQFNAFICRLFYFHNNRVFLGTKLIDVDEILIRNDGVDFLAVYLRMCYIMGHGTRHGNN